jgi:hypothetical protein
LSSTKHLTANGTGTLLLDLLFKVSGDIGQIPSLSIRRRSGLGGPLDVQTVGIQIERLKDIP